MNAAQIAGLIAGLFAQPIQALALLGAADMISVQRVKRLAILVVANEWECEFEWRVHASLALDNGVPASMIEAVRTGAAVGSADNVLGMVRAAVEELLGTRRLSDQTHEQLTEAIGEQGIFELLAVCGYYVLLAMVLNGHEVE